MRPSGIPVYQSAAQKYEVAGFDAGQYLVFVVSDLRGTTNLQIAANLAPGVYGFLSNAPSYIRIRLAVSGALSVRRHDVLMPVSRVFRAPNYSAITSAMRTCRWDSWLR